MKQNAPPAIISASEIGQFIYCQRAWWLARVAGHVSANSLMLEAGYRSHRRHGQTVQAANVLRRIACGLLALGALAAIVWLLTVVV